jgi:hypothetical protein
MQRNKVYAVTTLTRVALDLGEDEDFLLTSPTRWTPKTD